MVPVRALVYSRVSTDAQERDGTSLDTQERECVEYAESQRMVVFERIRDTASGSTLDRPGIERVPDPSKKRPPSVGTPQVPLFEPWPIR